MSEFSSISPVNGEVYVSRKYADEQSVQAAVQRAVQAQPSWRDMPLEARQKYCRRMLDYFAQNKEAIAEEISWQMGRPIRYAAGELSGFAERAEYMMEIASESLKEIRLPPKPGFDRFIRREPLGLVVVLAPWNYPYLTAVNAIVPALLAGNVVMLKHSVQTPLCAERFQAAFDAAGLPAGVFQALHLDHQQTAGLLKSSLVNHVAFTGSVAGGRMVEEAVAGQFKTLGLELGGKDPAYVRADADVPQAIETIVDGAFFNSGQSCCGIERAYVHAEVYETFVAGAVDLVKQYVLGPSNDAATTLGPMVKPEAADFVREQIAEAVAAGAKTLIEESAFALSRSGTPYMAPQILVDVNHSMRIMTEESFGPVLGIQKVDHDEDAIQMMNDSEFGLTAAVFTRDIHAGTQIAGQLEAGTVFLNRCDYLDPALAWTGVKNSGKGCTLSGIGFEQLTRPKSFHIKHVQS